jgi:hypothetical protein
MVLSPDDPAGDRTMVHPSSIRKDSFWIARIKLLDLGSLFSKFLPGAGIFFEKFIFFLTVFSVCPNL